MALPAATQAAESAASTQIWTVEDDPTTQTLYQTLLSARYGVRQFVSLEAFMSALDTGNTGGPSLVIADIRLGSRSFLNFINSGERARLNCPLMIVSCVDDLEIMRTCLREGACDFMAKPFNEYELQAKVERYVDLHDSKNVLIDPVTLTVSNGVLRSCTLTSRELQILAALQQSNNCSMTRHELKTRVWGGIRVNRNTFNVHLFNLRKKIAPLGLKILFTPTDLYTLHVDEKNEAP